MRMTTTEKQVTTGESTVSRVSLDQSPKARRERRKIAKAKRDQAAWLNRRHARRIFRDS
jgi:hypothetical protein